jgi:hypothetical protein
MKKIPPNPFQPGNRFGRGRPQGSRNKATIALQEMLDGHGESITKKCALLALQGEPTALRLCMDRLIPPKKDHAVKFRRRPTTTAAEIAAAMDAVLQDMADAHLTPAEGQMIMASLEGRLRVIQDVEHEARMAHLEVETDPNEVPDPQLILLQEAPQECAEKDPETNP